METMAHNTSNSFGYVKCGEILKSKKSFQDPYFLRCIQCKEIYLLLESFIYHLNDDCKRAVGNKKKFQESMDYSTNDEEVEHLECEVDHVKLENNNEKMVDPLTVVKNEVQQSFIKEEPLNLDESKIDGLGDESYTTTDYPNQDDYGDIENDAKYLKSQNKNEYQEIEHEEVEIVQKTSNANGVSSAFVSNFMKSEKNVTVLIAAFKDKPQLWNKNMQPYGNKLKRREFMDEIAQDLNKNHNLNINGSRVSEVVVHLYRKYQDDLQRDQEKDDNKKQFFIRPWYLKQLNFIKPYLENFSLEILDPNLPTLTTEQIVQLLEIYKSLPHLWNSNLIENHFKNKRHESILEMLKQLETNMNLKVTKKVLEQYLRKIHNHFSKEKLRILNNEKPNKQSPTEKSNDDYYERLMFLYEHVPPFRCNVCGDESISPLHFKMHKSKHDNVSPFTCSQCNRRFKKIDVYLKHAKRHLQDRNYLCKECGKKFINCTNLRLHMRIHTGERPYCCEICGESFRFLQALSTHRRRHEKRYSHTCKICSQGFYSRMSHDDHMNSHMNIRPHTCDICNKTFIRRRALQLHKVVHEDVRKYSCKLCGKTFKHSTAVSQHMKTHDIATTEERTFI